MYKGEDIPDDLRPEDEHMDNVSSQRPKSVYIQSLEDHIKEQSSQQEFEPSAFMNEQEVEEIIEMNRRSKIAK